jgi:rod shape determining protein RodA
LILIGWINIYAAVYNEEHQSILDMGQRYGKQLIWMIAAIILAIVVLSVDGKFYVIFSYHFYLFTIALLVLVLIFGKEVNGAKAWFEFGNVALQPAELGKFAANLAIARYISQFDFKMHHPKTFISLGLLILLPAGLIILQNDTGSALVYTVFILVFYREGLSGIILFWCFAAAALFILALLLDQFKLFLLLVIIAIGAYAFLRQNIKVGLKGLAIFSILFLAFWSGNQLFHAGATPVHLLIGSTSLLVIIFLIHGIKTRIKPVLTIIVFFIFSIGISLSVNYFYKDILVSHQRERIDQLLGIQNDVHGAGWNVNQSKIAVGSGGLLGKGFLKGTQTKFNFVPEQSTDFIFCTIGEEWGFVGSVVVLGIFLLLLVRLVTLSERQRSRFSRIYGYGVASILFFHIAINISMTIGLAPVIGIPLPFISYGGSSLWAFTVLLFIFLRLDASRKENL